MKSPTPEEIKELRKAHNLRQSDVAEALHVTLRTVQFWEKGDRECSPANWELLQLKTGEAHLEMIV